MTTNPRLRFATASRGPIPVLGVCAALALLAGASSTTSRPVATTLAVGTAFPDYPCPAQPSAPPGTDLHGQTLSYPNFTGKDLRNWNFEGATLISPVFIKADLRGANFHNVTFADGSTSGAVTLPADFTLAKLGSACFVKAIFKVVTYFTYADLTGTDFSSTDLSVRNQVIFGRLSYTASTPANNLPRPTFRSTAMSCDFFAQWKDFDLTSAAVRGCAARMKGADLSGAILSATDLSGLDLTGTKWSGTVLEGTNFEGATLDGSTGLNGTSAAPARLSGARFNKASAVGVDFSNAQLYGADFTNADLSNAAFAGSVLTDGGPTQQPFAAKFDGARLKNVSFASAKLGNVTFLNANLYGTYPSKVLPQSCVAATAASCSVPSYRTGATCSCATMVGATLTNTDFTGAFLWGVDFSGANTTLNGTVFDKAILIGANFGDVSFRIANAKAPSFSGAMLQGADLGRDGVGLLNATLTGAYLDFQGGNTITLSLPQASTSFRGGPGAAGACVEATYSKPSIVPAGVTLDCPSGDKRACGPNLKRPYPNRYWNNGAQLANAPIPGWYATEPTYEPATTAGCTATSNW